MQVAKLFASLGFQVDDSQLVVFEKRLKDVRHSTAMFARNLRLVNTNLRSVRTSMANLNSTMAANLNVAKANQRISGSFNNIRSNVNRVVTVYRSLETASNRLIPILNRIRSIVWQGSNAWRTYALNATIARDALRSFTQQMNAARAAARNINVNINQNNRGGHGGQGSGGSAAGQAGLLAGGAALLRPMVGGLAAGGAIGAGVAIKEIITAGREMQKMDNVLLVSSRNSAEYAKSLEYVRKTANYLGVDIVELGNAYAKTLQATQKKLGLDVTEKMFTGMGELMTTMQLNTEDQKGVFRAVTQMFTKGKIQAEEMLQIAERGLPALQLIREATKQVYKTDDKGFEKLQLKGLLDPARILPVVAENMAKMARNNDALNNSLKSSVAGQSRFKNSLKEMSYALSQAGLDKAISELFTGLSKLLDVVRPLAVQTTKAALGIIELSKAITSAVSEHKAFFAIVVGIPVALTVLRGSMILTVGRWWILVKAITLGLKLINFAAKKIAILAILWGIYEFGLAYREHLSGKNNWVTVLISSLTLIIAKLDILRLKFKSTILDMQISWLKGQRFLGLVPKIGEKATEGQKFGQIVTNPMTYTGLPAIMSALTAFSPKPPPVPPVDPMKTLNIKIEPLTIVMPNGTTQQVPVGGAFTKK